MVSRKSATKSKGKVVKKGGKSRNLKKKTANKVKTKAKTPTRAAGKRKRNAAKKKSTTPLESATLENNGTIDEVRSSMDDVIDNAKKVTGAEQAGSR